MSYKPNIAGTTWYDHSKCLHCRPSFRQRMGQLLRDTGYHHQREAWRKRHHIDSPLWCQGGCWTPCQGTQGPTTYSDLKLAGRAWLYSNNFAQQIHDYRYCCIFSCQHLSTNLFTWDDDSRSGFGFLDIWLSKSMAPTRRWEFSAVFLKPIWFWRWLRTSQTDSLFITFPNFKKTHYS